MDKWSDFTPHYKKLCDTFKTNTHRSFRELLRRSVKAYNFFIDTVTIKKSIETFFGRRVSSDPKLLKKDKEETLKKLSERQKGLLIYYNANRSLSKEYSEETEIFVQINKTLVNKH